MRDQQLLVRDMDTGAEHEIVRAPAGTIYRFPRWSPDDRHIAYVVTTSPTGVPGQNRGSNVAIATVESGCVRVVWSHAQPGTTVEGIAWAAGSTALYLGVLEQQTRDGRIVGTKLTLQRLELTTGERSEITEDAAYPTVARDGSRIAC
jgi:hypothetical protein